MSLYPIMLHMPRISQPKPSPWWEYNAEIAARCERVHDEAGRIQSTVKVSLT